MKNELPNGRFVITGGAGFLGSHLCETLLSRGREVVAMDNLITGQQHNIAHLMKDKKFTFLNQDITQPIKLDGGVAGVLHFASPASPIDYQKYPIETLKVGAIGTDNILQFAQEKNCPILVASTSEIYGDPLEHPQRESYWGNVNTIGPRGCYDESKRYLEALTMAYHRKFNMRTRIIRIFNTYGPRMRTDDGRIVPNFCIQALKNQDVTVNGKGDQTRSFCYVSDLVEGILRVFSSDYNLPINLGNPKEMTVLEFAQYIIKLSGSSSKIVYRPMPEDDPKTRRPDISRAKEIIGWEPTVPLEKGLAESIAYFKSVI